MAPLMSGSVEKLEAVLLGSNRVLPGGKTRKLCCLLEVAAVMPLRNYFPPRPAAE